MRYRQSSTTVRKTLALTLCVILLTTYLPAYARREEKTVRVGWYESSFNQTDSAGRRSGYAYEYQLKLAAYAGWRYEYINGSWSELMGMLERGEIDLMSDVSYTPEREKRMFYPTLPMGTEEYYLFVAPDNTEISRGDYATLSGKRIGVNRGSVQRDFFLDWTREHGVEVELIEVTCDEMDSLHMLYTGELDAYVTVDSFTEPDLAKPICKIGSSDFYFTVSLSRPDLLIDLNNALGSIQDENRFYNQVLFEKYFLRIGANTFLTQEEVNWLAEHGSIRLGYQDNYLAFCAADEVTGELTGALKDYLDYTADCMTNAHLEFEPVAYPTAAAAMEALRKGEVDCIFPLNLSVFDTESQGFLKTPPLMTTDIYALVRDTDQQLFERKEHVVAAVTEGDLNLESVLRNRFPSWKKVYFPDITDSIRAVDEGVADCVLISNYRYNSLARLCKKHDLIPLTIGEGVDFCFGLSNSAFILYSILAKTVTQVPKEKVSAVLSFHITEEAKLTLRDFIEDHLPAAMAIISAVLLIILLLLLRTTRLEKQAKQLIAATEKDDLTGLYNRKYFFQYVERFYKEHLDTPMDAVSLNLEQFHSVNALHGRAFGDLVLRAMGSEIQAIAQERHGIAGHFGADRFYIYIAHCSDYQALFDRLQGRLNVLSPYANLRLRMGVMPWQKDVEPEQLFDRARTACNMARGHFLEHLIVFDERVRDRELFEERLRNDLRFALENFEFEVFYQPKFNIQSDPPVLVSAEALVRWRHHELGMISPMDFVPLFERNGQISYVDKYVWAEAARQVASWREQYGVTLPVSVNLSRVDIFDPMLETILDEIVLRNGIEKKVFRLEVTESAYTENAEQLIQVVHHLRQKGYIVEMDDFGTGYSSLNMLSSMPVDVLKMDRGFVRNIEHEEKDIKLVALILDLAKCLQIPVVAEGVETEEQLQLLKKLGCTAVQGFYFSRPLHAKEFEEIYIQKMQRK